MVCGSICGDFKKDRLLEFDIVFHVLFSLAVPYRL